MMRTPVAAFLYPLMVLLVMLMDRQQPVQAQEDVSSNDDVMIKMDDSTPFNESSSSFELFDSSEEVQQQVIIPSASSTTITSSSSSPASSTLSPEASLRNKAATWPWMVFVLTGNSTVASRRQRDLGTYLRLNLAARLDADYNDVIINRIILTSAAILANLSVEPSHLLEGVGASGLEALSQGNVTLLELSGHEFQVEKIIRPDDVLADNRVSMEMSSLMAAGLPSVSTSSEVSVYGAVGAVFLFLMVALLLGLSFNSPCKAGQHHDKAAAYLSSRSRDQSEEGTELKTISFSSGTCTPPVIYTEQLARQSSGSVGLILPSSRYIPNTTVLMAELHRES